MSIIETRLILIDKKLRSLLKTKIWLQKLYVI